MPPHAGRLTEAEFDALVDQMRQQAQLPARARLPKHLTELELAERWDLSPQAVQIRRKNGDVPPYLVLTEGPTKQTIRYRLVDVEAYEAELLVDPRARASA